MGKVLRFRRRHARASSKVFKPKTTGAIFLPLRASVSEKTKIWREGILPSRPFQFRTAVMPTPAKDAATSSPPSALTTSSTELSMSLEYSQRVITSRGHETAVDASACGLHIICMDSSSEELARRVKASREALGLSQAKLCKRIGCSTNRWSQYENGKRDITLEIAMKLCHEFRLSLDWIYRGDPSSLPHELRLDIKTRMAA
jgi:DNA-binding XRE family transcriptional regulator